MVNLTFNYVVRFLAVLGVFYALMLITDNKFEYLKTKDYNQN